MKGGKILKLVLILFLALGCFRFVLGNDRPLNIMDALHATEEEGGFYDYDKFWIDIQKVKWNFTSLTNSLSAENGATYQTYLWREPQGATPGNAQRVYNSSDELVGYFLIETETKPSGSTFTEWIAYVGNFLSYVGRIFVSLGGVLVDVLLSVIDVLYRAGYMLYYLIFR